MEKPKLNNHYILILCGGTGPRLWPLSRANHPKQFLKLFDSQSLLESTIKRTLKIVPKDQIFIVSNQKYLSKIKSTTKNLIPVKNIISEPLKRNTALAILYATALIKKQNPNAIISSFPSDHFISNIGKFKQDIIKAKNLAKNNPNIVTIGIKPSNPNQSFGYIIPKKNLLKYYSVTKFIEKPDANTAIKLIKQKAYWNSGIYTFSIPTLESELKQNDSVYSNLYRQFELSSNEPKKIIDIYLNSPELAFDRVVSEKSKNLIVIPATFDWSDVGEWKAVFNQLSKDKKGIVSLNLKTNFVEINSQNCLLSTSTDKLIGLVNVDNLAIIDTPDALLICNMNDNGSAQVRDLVTKIVQNQKLKPYFLEKK